MAVSLKVAGVDVTARVRLVDGVGFTTPLPGQRSTSNFTLEALNGDPFSVTTGQTVQWFDGTDVRFLGSVDQVNIRPIGRTGGFYWQCSCISLEQRFDKRFVTGTFEEMTDAQIIALILSEVGEDVTIGTIETGETHTLYLTEYQRVSDIFTNLANVADKVWYIDVDGSFNYRALDSVAAPFDADGSDMLLALNPARQLKRSDYRNQQLVQVAGNLVPPQRDVFAGDGSVFFQTTHGIKELVSVIITSGGFATQTGHMTGVPNDNDVVTVGPFNYIFNTVVNNKDEFSILIGATAAECAENLILAINGGAGFSVKYSFPTWVNFYLSATRDGTDITVKMRLDGDWPNGNFPTTTSTVATFPTVTPIAAFSWDGDSVQGGTNGEQSVQTFDIKAGAAQWSYDPGTFGITQNPLEIPVGASSGSLGFVGAGLDDLVVSGDFTGIDGVLAIEIDSAGTPDTFKWSINGGQTFTSGVAITGAAQLLSEGISVTFGATTGHTAGDAWRQFVNSGNESLIVVYKPLNFGLVVIQDDAAIAERKAAEGASGIYANLVQRTDLADDSGGLVSAAALGRALLASYSKIAEVINFATDTYGLRPGQILTVNAPKLGSVGDYFIQSVTASAVASNAFRDHFRYAISAFKSQ